MIRLVLISIAVVSALGGLLHGREASAQAQPPIVVGVVDYDQILDESKAGKSVKAAVKKLNDSFKAEFTKQEKTFNDKGAALRAEQANLSEDEFKKKMNDIQSEMQAANEKFREKQMKIEASRDNALRQIKKALDEIVTGIATERSMTLVFSKLDLVVSDKRYDITAEALKRLDAKLPSVKM